MGSDIYDMKHRMEGRWTALGMLLWLCAAPLLSLHAQEGFSTFQEDIASMEKKAANTRIEAATRQSNASPAMDIHYYRCQWEIDPAQRYIRGKVTACFRLNTAASFIVFDLVDLLTVDSVHSGSASLSFSRPGNQSLMIPFSSQLPAGTDTAVTIYYQGTPPAGAGFGSFSLSTHAGQPVLWTLSEPFGAMDWWPCKNGLDDKADSIDIVLVTPEAYTGVANGMMVDEQVSNGWKSTHWKHRYPISTYLVAIAATNYVTLRDSVWLGNTQMPIIQYVYPESATNFKQAAAVTGRSLAMLHDAFGPYPFIAERYGHTQFSWGGGMEHQTNSFMFNTNETLIVHEAAHQWFGNQVTCAGWPDIWLNEGFALFCTNYNMERFHPNLLPSTLRAQINSITSQPGGSVWVSDSTNGSRIFNFRLSYLKGGWLVRMLRWTLGDSAFFRGVRRYLNDPALRYGFARTADLQRNLEAESGIPLDEFFRDWFYGEGYPSYTLQWTPIGNGLVNTTLSQTSSHASVSFFEMPVPIRFWNNQQDTTLVIAHQRQAQAAMYRLSFTPDSAAIDPDMFLISAKNRVEKTPLPDAEPNTVSIFPNPVGSSFQLFLRNFQSAPLTLSLYNAKGQLLWRDQQQQFSGNDIRRVDTGKLPGGVYFLRVQSGSNIRSVHKILK